MAFIAVLAICAVFFVAILWGLVDKLKTGRIEFGRNGVEWHVDRATSPGAYWFWIAFTAMLMMLPLTFIIFAIPVVWS